MHVLLVINSLQFAGAEWQVVDISLALQRRGHRVTVACKPDGILENPLRDQGVAVLHLHHEGGMGPVIQVHARQLAAFLAQNPVDVVHAHLDRSMIVCDRALRKMAVPLVITQHGPATIRWRKNRPAVERAYERAARIIAVSHVVETMILDEYGIPPDRVAYIPNAVKAYLPDQRFDPPGCCHGRPLVGMVSRLHPEKGEKCFWRLCP